MRHLHHFSSSSSMAPSNSLSRTTTTTAANHHHQKKHHLSHLSNPNNNNHCSTSLCKHSPSATLDILILILVLFSGTFLITSYFSYIFQSLSLLLPPISTPSPSLPPLGILAGFVVLFVFIIVSFEICCGYRARKCGNSKCKGLKKAMEFDLQLQTEECLRSGGLSVREIDELPWKGGSEGNGDYECLRAELRKMAPPNGRAVLLFRAKCGCPIAKLEGWGAKRGRKHKKGLALHGGGHHR